MSRHASRPAGLHPPITDSAAPTPLAAGSEIIVTFDGTNGADRIRGTAYSDVIFGYGGGDLISGGGWSPTDGPARPDTVRGGAGNDRIYGDAIAGDMWSDGAMPRAGSDVLFGEDGDDLIVGDHDQERGPGGDDQLLGGAGDDLLIGDIEESSTGPFGDDRLDGGVGNDTLVGDAGEGGEGPEASVGADILAGGCGDDRLFGDFISAYIVYWETERGDTLRGGDGDDLLTGDVETTQWLGYRFAGKDRLAGGAGADLLYGDAVRAGSEPSPSSETWCSDDGLTGGDGNDRLWGDLGAAFIREGGDLRAGSDILRGGDGDDILRGDIGNVTTVGGNDRLFADAGNDRLFGGAGDDRLSGAAGSDRLDGGAGEDVAVFTGTRADYRIEYIDRGVTVTDLRPESHGGEGSDRIYDVETLRFRDQSIAVSPPPAPIIDYDPDPNIGVEKAHAGKEVWLVPEIDDERQDRFSLVDDAGGRFTWGRDETAGHVVVADGFKIDYETARSHTVTVRATDAAGSFRDQTFEIRVLDRDDIQANATTAGPQRLSGISGGNALATLADGSLVAAWSAVGPEGDANLPWSIVTRRFASAGRPLGGEVTAATSVPPYVDAAVAALDGGGFVATWDSWGEGVKVQRFGDDGLPEGGSILAASSNPFLARNVYNPTVLELDDGGFLVAWTRSVNPTLGPSKWSIEAQRYDADGVAVGGVRSLVSQSTQVKDTPTLADLDGDRFVMAWTGTGVDSSDILVQRFTVDAGPADPSPPGRVNAVTLGVQEAPAVAALANGGFVVAWETPDGAGPGIAARLFAENGAPVSGEFRVNATTAGDQRLPSVAALADGGFVVSWQSASSDGTGLNVMAQRYAADGRPVGGEITINETLPGDQANGHVTGLDDGAFAAIWSGPGPLDSLGISLFV